MRITGLAIVPPPTAADLPKVTPELLASVLARYSRSNEGLAAILAKVDLAQPDASIDRILKFVGLRACVHRRAHRRPGDRPRRCLDVAGL